jgi:ABC-type multidrug transport system ATPase subunit
MITIQANEVNKKYGDTIALRDLSLSVEKGELFGLIGPDGAGKTSLIRILTTLLLADKGTATVNGHDVVKSYRAIRRQVGYMPGRFSLYQDLSVEENLRFFATAFGTTIEANYDVIRDIYQQIEPFRRRRAGALSGGMKQKLALSCALVHRPEVLFLDEPTTGVDPVSRQEFWQILKGLQERGITILVSTPYMDEASLCDRIALIQDGQLLGIDTPAALRKAYPHPLWDLQSSRRYELLHFLRQQEFTLSVFPFGETLHLATRPDVPEHQIRESCYSQGFTDIQLTRIEATIEDCFMDRMAPTADPEIH